ncbi:MAG TPA: BTAD domain-containing putative transcriptional regulator [Candidatus Dormibacteraeota bacterium]
MERPRLIERLAERFERRVTVLAAGPGFGKTSLLRQALERNSVSPRGIDLWHACRPAHESGALLGVELCALAGVPSPDDVDPAERARVIADRMWRRAPVDVALVLDDVRHLPAGSSGADLLAALLDGLPDNGHLVLATRAANHVPVARLDSLGQVAWIDERDLCFTEAELGEIAAARSVPVQALEGTGGWPALVELAVLAHTASVGGRTSVADYVWEEVLARLPAQRRRDLAVLGGLGELDGELAAGAVGHDVDLEELLSGLPLVVRAGGRFRMHPLWDDVLSRAIERPHRSRARVRAAEVLCRRGELEDAMRLAAGEADWPAMRSVIRAACATEQVPVSPDVLAAWLEGLPDAWRAEPEGRLLAAMVSLDRTPFDADALFESAARAFRARGDRDGELAALIQWNVLSFRQLDRDGIARQTARLRELADNGHHHQHSHQHHHHHHHDRAESQVSLAGAMAAFVEGDWHHMLVSLEPICHGARPGEQAVVTVGFRAQALLGLGLVAEADLVTQHALQIAGPRNRRFANRTRVMTMTLAARWDEAAAIVDELLADSRDVSWLEGVAIDHALAAQLACRRGDVRAARRALAAGRATRRPGDRSVQMAMAFATAACAILEGDEDRARATLRAELAERPVGSPGTHLAHLCSLAPLYVLLPETRAAWDARELPGPWFDSRAVARALAALREGGGVSAAEALRPFRAERLQAHLPAPWAVELIVAGSPHVQEAGHLVERMGPDSSRWVGRLADSSLPAVTARAGRFLAKVPRPPREAVRLCLLGPTRLTRGGELVDDALWRRPKVRELLAYLVVHTDPRRSDVIADLWPDADEVAGGNNLRVTLFSLRAVLEPDRQVRDASFFIRSDGSRLCLVRGDHLDVDIAEFGRRLEDAQRAGSPTAELDAYLAAIPLRRGPYLGDLQDPEWTVAPREDVDGRFVAAALRAGELVLGRDAAMALDLASRAMDVDPYSERAFRLKAAAYSKQGARAAARQLLARCRAEMDRHGLAPEPETEMLERMLGLAPDGADGADL